MAAIMEFTRFSDAVSGGTTSAVRHLFTMTVRPKTIFISIAGANIGYRVGETITYINGNIRFSGKITYIFNSRPTQAGHPYFNLYITHPNPQSISGTKGGTVYPGIVQSAPVAIPSYAAPSADLVQDYIVKLPIGIPKPFVSASTILEDAANSEVLQTPNGEVIAPEAAVAPTPSIVDQVQSNPNMKYGLIAAATLAVVLFIRKAL